MMKKLNFIILLIILIVFILPGCVSRPYEEKPLFTPLNPVNYGIKSIYSYTIKNPIEGTNVQILSRLNDIKSNNIKTNFQAPKKIENNLYSIPKDSNLWIEIYWLDYNDASWKRNQTIQPDGYIVYRSFDGIDYTKIATTTSGLYIDYSSDLEINKKTWYGVSSYKGDEESSLVKLGSALPLDTFNVRLVSPYDNQLDVTVQPTFVWEPTKKLISPESNVEYHYTMAIYDLIQSSNYIYPVFEESNQRYYYDFKTVGANQVAVTFKGSQGSPEYNNLKWVLISENGVHFYSTNLLEEGKTYDWGVDYAYAIAYDIDSISYSIAIDTGFNISPKGDIMPEKQNEFTTKTSE